MNYQDFIESKKINIQSNGIDVIDSELGDYLFDFQKYIVKIALKKGKYAIFADCGMGKTIMQLEWARIVHLRTNKPVLIITPLAVSGQTIKEGDKFSISIEKLKGQEIENKIYITNYEQIENIDCSKFSGIVLDESSILKSYSGKYKTKLIEYFAKTEYKLCCTATPSPNDEIELGNHAEFLNIMRANEMLSLFFINDIANPSVAGWRLKKHAIDTFWQFVASWSICISKPSDLGFDDCKFILPDIKYINCPITQSEIDFEQGSFFRNNHVSATDLGKDLRLTVGERMNKVKEIIDSKPDENFIIWTHLNDEGEYLRKIIPDIIEVKGSDSPIYKEDKLLGFANNDFRLLCTKPKIAQFGLNYQNCHNVIFASLSFSFEELYQAVRRVYRFGQKSEVDVYLITTLSQGNVIGSIRNKESKFKNMQKRIIENMKSYYLKSKNMEERNLRTIKEDSYTLLEGDCVQRIKEIPDKSIGFSVFSPPFADLYVYSDSPEDMGNVKNYDEFAEHFKFLIPELKRVIKNGRLVAVHCMDLPIQKGKEGYIGIRDFPAYIRQSFEDNGFIFHSRVTIWKDPVVEMQRTKALGLLHKQVKKDSSMCRVGLPDYLMVFRHPDQNEEPIENVGIDVDTWQKYASPVWYDINYSNTLQRTSARDEKDEKHLCPLQLDTIKRAIHLWSNAGDIVLSPFAGIGSEGFQSIKMGRKFIGIELKESYFNQANKNLEMASIQNSQLTLI